MALLSRVKNSTVKATEAVPVYCKCRMPEMPGASPEVLREGEDGDVPGHQKEEGEELHSEGN